MKKKSIELPRLSLLALSVALYTPGLTTAATINSGWTLTGNGRNAVIDSAATFGTLSAPVTGISDGITTVWKWDAINSKWAFFTPQMDSNQLATYAGQKGYSVLKSILPGEGYWINASKTVTIPDQAAAPFNLGRWNLTSGWNLVSTGAGVTAGQFATSIAPFAATTLWAWDPAGNWYFYTPTLDSTALASYIAQKQYKDFGTKSLTDGIGFWVNRAAVTGSPTASLSALDQAKSMFAQLRTTAHSWSNSSGTGALNVQAKRMSADVDANVTPEMSKVANRIGALTMAVGVLEDAKIYTSSNTNGLVIDGNPLAGTKSSALARESGDSSAVWYGYGSFDYCWTDSLTPSAITKVTCAHAGADSADRANSQIKMVIFELTGTATTNQYTYTAARYNVAVSVNQYGQPSLGVPTLATGIPAGNGTIGKTASGATVTGLTLNGTLPPSAITLNGTAATGVDTVAISAARTALAAANNYRYALSGSVSTSNLADSSKVVTLSLDSGSYIDLDEGANPATTDAKIVSAKLIGTAQTVATKFTGTLDMGSFMTNADMQNSTPSSVTINGSISDISAGGAGAIFNGTVTANRSNYNLYHSTLPYSATNISPTTVALAGTLQLPSRPTMGLQLSLQYAWSDQYLTDKLTLSGLYTYDNGMSIALAGTNYANNPGGSSLTLTNQDSITVTFPNTGDSQINKGTTNLGYIRNGMIYYTDGTFESLQ